MDTRIEIFYRQYLQQVAPEELSFPPDNVLLDSKVQDQMYHYMFTTEGIFKPSNHEKIHMPPANYQKRVMKQLTRRIEGAIHDPDEDVGHIPVPFSQNPRSTLFSVPPKDPH